MSDPFHTDQVVTTDELAELFTFGERYDGPDLDHCEAVQVPDGEWRREPFGFWRFWQYA